LHTLAALISGIVGSKRTNLPAIAGQVPDGTKRESRVKKFYRWITNQEFRFPAREDLWPQPVLPADFGFVLDSSQLFEYHLGLELGCKRSTL
jgi:hypothetical protein